MHRRRFLLSVSALALAAPRTAVGSDRAGHDQLGRLDGIVEKKLAAFNRQNKRVFCEDHWSANADYRLKDSKKRELALAKWWDQLGPWTAKQLDQSVVKLNSAQLHYDVVFARESCRVTFTFHREGEQWSIQSLVMDAKCAASFGAR